LNVLRLDVGMEAIEVGVVLLGCGKDKILVFSASPNLSVICLFV
jgi:hypothetical protein